MTYNNLLETIGNTPIVKLNKVVAGSPHQFFAKLEYFNPGGSVKDRVAVAMIEGAEKRGELKPGGTIVEATSGNTGMGLAMVAAIKGYKSIFVMPDKISEEKRAILRAYGARVVITPTSVEPEDPRSYISVAQTLKKIIPNSILTNQYHNPDNPNRHFEQTGPEIWKQMEGKLDVFVGGAGTGGTVSGVGRYLKSQNPNLKVLCADPVGSILKDLFYHKKVLTPPAPYKVEGVGEDMLPENVHFQYMDDFESVSDVEAFDMTRRLVAEEGICVGPSSALSLVGAIKYSQKLKTPSRILILFPDSGKGYLSKAFNDQWLRDNGLISGVFANKKLKDVWQPTESTKLEVSTSIHEASVAMKKQGVDEMVVTSDGKFMGSIKQADILSALAGAKLKSNESIIHLVKGASPAFDLSSDLTAVVDVLLTTPSLLINTPAGVGVLTQKDLSSLL